MNLVLHYQSEFVWLVILLLTVLPVSLGARFAGAQRPGFIFSTIAVVLGGAVAWWIVHVMDSTLVAVCIAYLAMCAVYALVLRMSLGAAFGVSVIAFFLQVLIGIGLATAGIASIGIDIPGLNLPGLDRPAEHPARHRQ